MVVGELPVLIHNRSTTISGLENIIDYLDVQILSSSSSSSSTEDQQRQQQTQEYADLTAFTSHILHHGAPLLALSLFVSTENYTTITRPTYSALLPWPMAYIIPPQLRSRAQMQTAHLGLTSPDLLVDDDDDNQALNDSTIRGKKSISIIPESLRTLGSRRSGKTSVTGALTQQPQVGSARFRLDTLVDDFCAPLCDLLGSDEEKEATSKSGQATNDRNQKEFLLSSNKTGDDANLSSLDCLATAYLSLMLKPDLPQNWLSSRIRQRWPDLTKHATRMTDELWGGDDGTGQGHQTTLPWRDADDNHTLVRSLPSMLSTMGLWSGLPSFIIGGGSGSGNYLVHPSTLTSTPKNDATSRENVAAVSSVDAKSQQQQPHTLSTVFLTATAATAAVALAAAVAMSGYVALPHLSSPAAPTLFVEEGENAERRRNLSEMGEAGALLSSGVEIGGFAG